MKKEKVLIVHNYYQIPGGEDTVVHNEKKLLEDNGHEVVLYTRHNSELKEMSLIQKLLLPINAIFNLRTYIDIKKIIKEEQIDIVHVHNTLTLISPSVYYAARSMKIPIVQTVHNFRLLCPGATFYRDNHICEDCVSKGLRCAVRHNCYRDSKLQTLLCVINMKIHRLTGIMKKVNYICLTEFNKEKLSTLKQIDPERIYVKPNFVENHGDIIPAENRKQQYVFAGRLDKLKGIDLLLEAWKVMGNNAPKLVVCGSGPLEQWCHDFVKDNRLNNVELMGHVSNDVVREIVANSLALILPTQWYEGFPMSIVEAFSVGTPVIVSGLGNAGDIVEEGVNGFKVKSDTLEGIESAIKKLGESTDIYGTTFRVYSENYTDKNNYRILKTIYKLAR